MLRREKEITKKPNANILVIDDDPAIHRVFSRILQKAGYNVETAETGKEALEKIKIHAYDVALIDVKLPDINGLELLPILKKAAPSMIKIVITGYSLSEERMDALNLGADEFLKKPIKPEYLIKIIKEKLDAKANSQ